MAAHHAFPNPKEGHSQPLVVRTPVHAAGAGKGSRSARRRIPPEAGRGLEILGHAIEYLADEYVHEVGQMPSIGNSDPQVEAMQLLMAANREVYYGCPLTQPLWRRILNRLFLW